MILLIGFIIIGVITYYVGGLSKVTKKFPTPNFVLVWIFLIVAVLLNLVVTTLLTSLLLLGSAFSMPKGNELINLYALLILTVFQCTLLWLTVFESVKRKRALWGKYSLFLFTTLLLFFSILLQLNAYIYLAIFLLAYIAQLLYFRIDILSKDDFKTEHQNT